MSITRLACSTAASLCLLAATVADSAAGEVQVTLHRVTEQGIAEPVGRVVLRDSPHGMLVIPDLHGLEPGPHAAHIHEHPDCGPATRDGEVIPGGAAGGHYDPRGTGRYAGPYGDGALGDLPNLIVEADGSATIPVLAPRMTTEQARQRALMVHEGPDRYGPRIRDEQGHSHAGHSHGGRRMYCGVIR